MAGEGPLDADRPPAGAGPGRAGDGWEGAGEAQPGEASAGAFPAGGPAAGAPDVAPHPVAAVPAAPPGEGRPGLLDVLYAVLFQPRRAFPDLASDPPLRAAAAVVVAVSLMQAAVGMPARTPYGGGAALDPGAVLPLVVMLAVPVALGLWFGLAGTWHLAAELLGGRGTGRATLALTGLAQLPGIFSPPLSVLERVTGARALALLDLAVFAWIAVLTVWAVRAAHGIPAGRALLAVLAPVAMVAALAGAIAASIAFLLLRAGPLPPPLP